MKARILLYDLETSPFQGYTWGKYEQNVLAFTKERELLSFAFKWLGDRKVQVITRADFKDTTDLSLVSALWKLLDKADVVIAHNGDQFDNKISRARFIAHGLTPPSPFLSVDTRKLARQHFQFASNKLDDLAKFFGVGQKVRIGEGIDLWLACMAGDKKAFKKMAKYNKQDVVLLEKVYRKLLPWASRHPNLATIEGKPSACPKCSKGPLHSRGFQANNTVVYRKFQCMGCKGWSRSRVKADKPQPQKVAL